MSSVGRPNLSRRQMLWGLFSACVPLCPVTGSVLRRLETKDVKAGSNAVGWSPRGPSKCFRQFNLDWSWVSLRPEQISEFLSEVSPAAIAEFLAQDWVDGTVVMAVPHHGYCTHETKVGERFPSLRYDWFGAMVEQLHRRGISAFGYVTLNWNWKYIREHLGADFVHGEPDPDGICGNRVMLCLNAPGYLELVEAYTAEVMTQYPIDGMRWDILKTARGCRCAGCRGLYRELFGEKFPKVEKLPEEIVDRLYDETITRAVRRLYRLCKSLRPEVEVWQNHLNPYFVNPIHLSRELDVAYNEFGDAFRLLVIKGVSRQAAVINGLMNQTPTEPPQPIERSLWRLSLALGGRCYSYYGHKHTDPRTLLPDETLQRWHREQLAPFYRMVREIQPWLENAQPVTDVTVLFSEATRCRFPGRDRTAYLRQIEPWVKLAIDQGRPPAFLDVLDLADSTSVLSKSSLVIAPLISGLTELQVDQLRQYVASGGTLLVLGDAFRHDAEGKPLDNFVLSAEMALNWIGQTPLRGLCQLVGTDKAKPVIPSLQWTGGLLPIVKPTAGRTWIWLKTNDQLFPLLHVHEFHKGRCAWLAVLEPAEFVHNVVQLLAGEPPLRIRTPGAKAVLTVQPDRGFWIVHLLTDDPMELRLSRQHVPATRVVIRYPAAGWELDYRMDERGITLVASEGANDRLIVLGG